MNQQMKIRKVEDQDGTTFIFSEFPHNPHCDYWDDFMFCAMLSTGRTTENKMYYKGKPSQHFNEVDEMHIKFSDPIPSHRELKAFVAQMKERLH